MGSKKRRQVVIKQQDGSERLEPLTDMTAIPVHAVSVRTEVYEAMELPTGCPELTQAVLDAEAPPGSMRYGKFAVIKALLERRLPRHCTRDPFRVRVLRADFVDDPNFPENRLVTVDGASYGVVGADGCEDKNSDNGCEVEDPNPRSSDLSIRWQTRLEAIEWDTKHPDPQQSPRGPTPHPVGEIRPRARGEAEKGSFAYEKSIVGMAGIFGNDMNVEKSRRRKKTKSDARYRPSCN